MDYKTIEERLYNANDKLYCYDVFTLKSLTDFIVEFENKYGFMPTIHLSRGLCVWIGVNCIKDCLKDLKDCYYLFLSMKPIAVVPELDEEGFVTNHLLSNYFDYCNIKIKINNEIPYHDIILGQNCLFDLEGFDGIPIGKYQIV